MDYNFNGSRLPWICGISRWMQNRYLKKLSQDEFIKGYRKAQLIDVREEKEFITAHILGARNIPASQLRMRFVRNSER